MAAKIEYRQKEIRVMLDGEIDHHRARDYMTRIGEKIDGYVPGVCILDFQEVSFMDSSGIAIVINALRRMEQLGGRLRLQGLKEQPRKVLRAAGIEKIVEIREVIR